MQKGFAVAAGIVIGCVVAGAGLRAAGQQFDMAAVQKWNAAKVVHYQITGVYRGTSPGAKGQGAGFAQVTATDKVTVEADVDTRQHQIVGTPRFTNGKSDVVAWLSHPLVKCPPPTAQGAFEFFDATSAVAASSASIELKGTRTFPTLNASVDWPSTCSQRALPGSTEPASLFLALPSPVMLALPVNADPKFSISADRKSFSIKAEDWTWTYTPSIVQ